MKFFVVAVCALAAAAALGQSGLQVAGRRVELGATKAVAVGVTEAFWHPQGQAIAYYASDADGSYLGVYNVVKETGKAVVRFPAGTNVHFESWLASRPVYLLVTSSDGPGQGMRHWAVTTIDAQSLTAKEVWSNDYAKGTEVGVDVEASPSRDHALITITDPEGRHPVVLLDGAMSAVFSRDVAAAWAQGSEFAGWSVDGTAYFSAPVERPVQDVADLTVKGQFFSNATIELKVQGAGSNTLSELPIIGLVFRFARVAPSAGTPVLELMPANGGLRPVLSRGPFVGEATLPHVVYPKQEDAQVSTSDKTGRSGALWMVRLTGDEENPYSKEGLLIAAQAESFWMCPDGNWVAYEDSGALFLRKITYGGQPFSRALVGPGG